MFEMASSIALPQQGDLWHKLRNGQVPPLRSEYSRELETLILQVRFSYLYGTLVYNT